MPFIYEAEDQKTIYGATTEKSATRLGPHRGTIVDVKTIPKLTDLPDAMDNMGWQVAPKLMRRWFSNPAYTLAKVDADI